MNTLTSKPWWNYLQNDIKDLLGESFLLLEKSKTWRKKFHDYSFVVFPASKAYEGFLKKLLLDTGLISEKDYYGKHFRIGKSLNPSLDVKYRDESWVYDSLADFCKSEELPKKLWKTWKTARNLVFHWFPNEVNAITLPEAEDRVRLVIESIDLVYTECGVKLNK